MNRLCPLYSGYDTFLTMSKDNIRHFLELCYTSLSHSDNFEKQTVDIKDQMTAVKYVSDNMLNEIKQLGASGNILYVFAYRIGNLFEEFRKRDSQSEPEQNQFSIKGELTNKSFFKRITLYFLFQRYYMHLFSKRQGLAVVFSRREGKVYGLVKTSPT